MVHGILNPDAVKQKLEMLPPFLLLQLQKNQMLTFEVLSIRQKINAQGGFSSRKWPDATVQDKNTNGRPLKMMSFSKHLEVSRSPWGNCLILTFRTEHTGKGGFK